MFNNKRRFSDLRQKFQTSSITLWFKVVVTLVMCVMTSNVHAQSKSAWAFYDVKLSEIVRVGLSQLLNKSFVADDAFVRDERRVSIDLKADQADKAGAILIELLLQCGYKVDNEVGIWRIRKLIEKDREAENETFIYRPKYRSASYFYDVLGIGKNRNGANSSAAATNASNSGSAAGIRGTNSSQGEAIGGSTNANSQDTASAYIERSSDVVYIRGQSSQIAQYRTAITALDVPEEQVDITASVYEFQATESNATAIGAVINLAKGKITGQIGAVSAVADFIRLDAKGLQVLFSMLAEDKRFNLISSPNLRLKSGSSSRISVGASVPTLASTTQSSGQVTQSVLYQPTGIILDVQAAVYGEVIDIRVKQSISEAIATSTGVNSSPTLTTRDVQTNINMLDGESVVLGGLTSTKSGAGRAGLSFLPRFLDSKDKSESRTELLIFLRVTKKAAVT